MPFLSSNTDADGGSWSEHSLKGPFTLSENENEKDQRTRKDQV